MSATFIEPPFAGSFRRLSPCEELILRFPNEAAAGSLSAQRDIKTATASALSRDFQRLLQRVFYPFTDVIENLTGLGFVVHDFRLPAAPARRRMLSDWQSSWPNLTRTPDRLSWWSIRRDCLTVLELLLRYPESARPIAAIISIAGASNGSPVADDLYEFYRDWLAGLPIPGCDRGTGEEVRRLATRCPLRMVDDRIDRQSPCRYFRSWRCQELTVFRRY